MLAECKPGSVLVDHLSSVNVAINLKRINDSFSGSLLITVSLQQAGFTSSNASPHRTVGFYPTRFTISVVASATKVVSFLWHFP